MNLAFSTRDVAPAERLAAWRELVSRVFIPLKITPLGPQAGPPGDYEASVMGCDLGELRVWRVAAGAMSAERAACHIRPSASGDYLLALHARGTAHATQDGRRVDLEPGDLALFDSSRPYSIAFHADGQFEHIIFQIPRPSLDARHRDAGKATALRVPAASAPGHLANQDLRDLAIAEVARRWGYRSAAHFSRAFTARFGTTPREFRRMRARPPDAAPGREPARGELVT